MGLTSLLLTSCLVMSVGTSTASTGPTVATASLFGMWELTGVGGHHNLALPQRLVLVFAPAGDVKTYVWEGDDLAPQEVTGRYMVRDDLLEFTVPGSDAKEVFRVTWDVTVLVLGPLPEERPGLPLHFERRIWISP